ncbi:SGNH/GDSL hydrolase family protein [Actinomadura fibrosa]|uniref:SGNH/GDSL hydrolase family protein n=1 Tax=Actinomadura fibrosa TaxID=111802 RepID=A0ABW2XIH2_9ACTN|nr:SGNH/GDSL hydrolase family protein [Actinomadura fibrosa]
MKRRSVIERVRRPATLAALAPVLAVQAWRTVRRTPRLDPAAGDDRGVVTGGGGAGPEYRVVVIGESTAVGVGAEEHAEALPGHLAEALRERLRRDVAWSVAGENGATARKITDLLARDGPSDGGGADLVVVTVGINDLLRHGPLRRWTADMTALIEALRDRYGGAAVLIAGMPPVHRFPALPQPLRRVLGERARAMDELMAEAARAGGALHVPVDEAMARDPRLFASDGFHPSPAGYRAWAEDLARAAPVPADN